MPDKNKFTKLTDVVTDHLTSIQDALREYQDEETVAKDSVSNQMQALLARVRSIEEEADHTRDLLEAEKHKSNHDKLTSLPNRAAYEERAFHELRRFKRYHRSLTLAVCDIDFFKTINDRFGHQAGDKALKLIAKVIVSRMRTVDFVARLGGEEFVFIMPETTDKQALGVLEKVRKAVAAIPFRVKNETFQITTSFGVSEFVSDDTMDSVFERADKALYEAKSSGRNRCCIESKKPKSRSGTSDLPGGSRPSSIAYQGSGTTNIGGAESSTNIAPISASVSSISFHKL